MSSTLLIDGKVANQKFPFQSNSWPLLSFSHRVLSATTIQEHHLQGFLQDGPYQGQPCVDICQLQLYRGLHQTLLGIQCFQFCEQYCLSHLSNQYLFHSIQIVLEQVCLLK